MPGVILFMLVGPSHQQHALLECKIMHIPSVCYNIFLWNYSHTIHVKLAQNNIQHTATPTFHDDSYPCFMMHYVVCIGNIYIYCTTLFNICIIYCNHADKHACVYRYTHHLGPCRQGQYPRQRHLVLAVLPVQI